MKGMFYHQEGTLNVKCTHVLNDDDTTEYEDAKIVNVEFDDDTHVTMYSETCGWYWILSREEANLIARAVRYQDMIEELGAQVLEALEPEYFLEDYTLIGDMTEERLAQIKPDDIVAERSAVRKEIERQVIEEVLQRVRRKIDGPGT